MKQSVAISHLRSMMQAIQRTRSINTEGGISADDPLAAIMWPWLYDPKKAVLPILSKILDKVDETDTLKPLDYYNLMVIATQFEPLIGTVASMVGDHTDYPEEADMNWLRGWEDE